MHVLSEQKLWKKRRVIRLKFNSLTLTIQQINKTTHYHENQSILNCHAKSVQTTNTFVNALSREKK